MLGLVPGDRGDQLTNLSIHYEVRGWPCAMLTLYLHTSLLPCPGCLPGHGEVMARVEESNREQVAFIRCRGEGFIMQVFR